MPLLLSSSWSHPPSAARDKGIIGVIIGIIIFIYYIIWITIIPFYDGKSGDIDDIGIPIPSTQSIIHNTFPLPRSVAIEVPVCIGIIMLGVMSLYLGYIFILPEDAPDNLVPSPQSRLKRKKELKPFWEQLATTQQHHHQDDNDTANPPPSSGRSKSE